MTLKEVEAMEREMLTPDIVARVKGKKKGDADLDRTDKQANIRLSNKGIALLAAIETGLCPRNDDGGYDITAFTHYWELYQEMLLQNRRNELEDLREMLHEEGYQTTDDCAYQRKSYLKLTLVLLGGLIFGSLFTKLFLLLLVPGNK